ncbi:MAG TPA: hypothetical protein VK716_01915, partial [Terracidiphilus sp.]|nr:hypothetical protein [Terracidiphilus sp.]
EGKGGNAGTPGNKGTARRGASKGKQGSKKGFQTVVAIVGLLVVGSDMYALVTYKPPTLPAPVPVTAAPAATGPVSASAEGNHTVSIAGGSNNSVTFSDTSSSGNTPGKTKKGQK